MALALVGDPSFVVNAGDDEAAGLNWPEGATVYLEIDDPSTTGENYEPDLEMNNQVGPDGNVQFWFADQFDVQTGHEVTMTAGATTEFHVVQSVEVTEVDDAFDVVRGTADADDVISVFARNESGVANRVVTAPNGHWVANFAVPGVGEEEQDTLDLVPGVTGGALETDPAYGNETESVWRVANPTFAVDAPFEVFSTSQDALTPGDVVDVYVNAAEDRLGFDHKTMATVVDNGWGPQFNVSLDPFAIAPTDVVTVDYPSGHSKELVVIDLTLGAIDEQADTVSGTAPAGTAVGVDAGNEFGGSHRDVTADEFGAWTAYFATPPEDSFDLQEGVGGAAQVFDKDGDSTHRGFCIGCGGGEPGGDPSFVVNAGDDTTEGHNWPEGANVHLEIDDPSTTGVGYEPDLEMDVPVGDNTVGSEGNVGFWFADQFDVQTGHEVTMTAGATTEFHVVQSVEVTEVDDASDVVRGTADADDVIWVFATNEFEEAAIRVVTAPNGHWVANFAVPGVGEEEQDTLDLIPGVTGGALETDPVNGNQTESVWRVPNPRFSVDPLFGEIVGEDWLEGFEATITVDDPATTESPDVELSVPIEQFDPFAEPGFYAWVDPSEFVIEPGHIVRVTDGETTKTHEVTFLEVHGADAAADTVSGTGAKATLVEVFAHGHEDGAEREVVISTDGTWTADFSTVGPDEEPLDLRPGMGIEARQPDDDGDATTARWELIEPRLTADQFDDVVRLDWPDTGASFRVRVSALGNGSTWEGAGTTDQVGDAPWETGLLFDLYLAERDIVTGTLVELIDPATTEVVRSLEVSPLTVTQLDPNDDGTVHGAATPGSTLSFQMQNSTGWAWRAVEADANGAWITYPGHDPVDRGEEGDGTVEDVGLRFEVGVDLEQPDDDGDATVVRWGQYRIGGVAALPDSEIVSSYNWTGLWPATLTIEDNNGAVVYEQAGIPVDRGPGALEIYGEPVFFDAPDWENYFAVQLDNDFDLEPGHRVIVSDGLYTGITVVSEIVVTEVDLASDVISGTATPDDFVIVFAAPPTSGETPNDPGDRRARFMCTGADGTWEANFGAPLVGPLDLDCLPDDAAPPLGAGDVVPTFDLDHSTVLRGLASTTDSEDPFGNNPDDDDATAVIWWTHLTDLAATPELAEAGVDEVTFSATVNATDPTDPRRHVIGATVDWGDGQTSAIGPADLAPDGRGDIALQASHTYAVADVESIVLTVEFTDGHIEIEASNFVAVYDPTGGFVTGAGWIWSPAGAHVADPDLEGEARFGFVSRYQRGAKTPTGNSAFSFRAADLDFRSTSYDWMVVAGKDRVIFKGEGTVNDMPGHSFMITATDGDPDTFRIKIWNTSTGEVSYDNKVGTGDYEFDGTEITRGSIVVHAK